MIAFLDKVAIGLSAILLLGLVLCFYPKFVPGGSILLEDDLLRVVPSVDEKTCQLEVQIRNVGWFELEIRNVKTTCGCTRTQMESDSIPPGGSATLVLEVQPPRKNFTIVGVRIQSSDRVNSEVRFEVEVAAYNSLFTSPESVHFGDVVNAAEERLAIHYRNPEPGLTYSARALDTVPGVQLRAIAR